MALIWVCPETDGTFTSFRCVVTVVVTCVVTVVADGTVTVVGEGLFELLRKATMAMITPAATRIANSPPDPRHLAPPGRRRRRPAAHGLVLASPRLLRILARTR